MRHDGLILSQTRNGIFVAPDPGGPAQMDTLRKRIRRRAEEQAEQERRRQSNQEMPV